MRKKKYQETETPDFHKNNLNYYPAPVKKFRLEYLTEAQRQAHAEYMDNDILFLIGAAGTGKSFLAIAFALKDLIEKKKDKIILTRPLVEAGENLGYLPGSFQEKAFPHMQCLYDCLDEICGKEREAINKKIEIAPIAYLRGRSFHNAICILDEAQNCTAAQLKLFLTRLGKDSKMIITGDPSQSDLHAKNCNDLLNVMDKIKHLEGIGNVHFTEECIVRHPLIREIVKLI